MPDLAVDKYNWKPLIILIVFIAIGDLLVDKYLPHTAWPHNYDLIATSILVIYIIVSVFLYRKNKHK